MALEAIRGEATIAELVSKHGVHQTLTNAWKRQAIDGLASVFSAQAKAAAAKRESELEKLHAKIGQLVPGPRSWPVSAGSAAAGSADGAVEEPAGVGPAESL